MTIKKRLARSNIAMLVIPLLTAAVLLLLGLGAALLLLRENMPSVHTVAYPSGSARWISGPAPFPTRRRTSSRVRRGSP